MSAEPEVPLTRAAMRRSRADGQRGTLSRGGVAVEAPPVRPRPVMTVTVVAAAALVAVCAATGEVVLVAGAVALTCLVLAWCWPRLLNLPSPASGAAALTATALAVIGAVLSRSGEPYLTLVPTAVAVGLVAVFFQQLARRDGRVRLAESTAALGLAVCVMACGAMLIALSRVLLHAEPLVVMAAAAGAAALVDLALERPRSTGWTIPAAMLAGVVAAVVVDLVQGGDYLVWAGAVGLLVGAIGASARRVLSQLPAVDEKVGAMAAGCASFLVCSPVVYLLTRYVVG